MDLRVRLKSPEQIKEQKQKNKPERRDKKSISLKNGKNPKTHRGTNIRVAPQESTKKLDEQTRTNLQLRR